MSAKLQWCHTLRKCYKSYRSAILGYISSTMRSQKCLYVSFSLSLFLSHSFLLPIKGKLQKFSVCRQFLQALTFNIQPYCAIYCSIFVGSNTNKRSTVRFKNVRYSQIPRSFHNISISRLMNLFMILIPSVVLSVFHIARQFHFLLSYWFHDPWRRRLPQIRRNCKGREKTDFSPIYFLSLEYQGNLQV